jgi:copper oxidase (laccase) domain-containing protein
MTTTTSTSRRSSSSAPVDRATYRCGLRLVHVRCSRRGDGDFHRVDVPFPELEARRRTFVDLPWSMLDEHHGVIARDVTQPGEHDGATGDVLTTGLTDAVLGCWVGDCAPVVLVGERQRLGVAHAGWRGLAAGVLDVAVAALAEEVTHLVLGPTIGPCCYEFGADDLDTVAGALDVPAALVSARTRRGTLALDVPGAIAAYADRLGVTCTRLGGCTGCTYPGFSHRVHRDRRRHVVAAWMEAP